MRRRDNLEAGRRGLHHPRRQAGERAIGLAHDDERDAAALKAPPDLNDLAEAGMEAVGDPGFTRLFAGSMSGVRESPGWS